jgi:hypothetical protein
MLEVAALKKLKKFRQGVYDLFLKRSDASFELVDALSSNTQAKHVVELSLNPHYRRNYCSITRSIDEFYADPSEQAHSKQNNAAVTLLAQQCPPLTERPFHLIAVDCTPNERLFSPTLEDRSPVYTPRPAIAGNKPITIGHQYSVAVYLPEKSSSKVPPWVIPLSAQRVHTEQNGTLLGMDQISAVVQLKDFKDTLCVSVADSAYSTPACLLEANQHAHLVHISRLRTNRTLARALRTNSTLARFFKTKKISKKKRGRPKKYGDVFRLSEEATWGLALESTEIAVISAKNYAQTIKIEGWDNITLYGPEKIEPFRVVRIRIFKENGEPLFKRALWVVISGQRCHELSLQDIFESYRQRFDIEHFFRFGKTRLMLDQFQTPEAEHEEAWWQYCMFAYTQLYLGREIARNHPRPWEKYLSSFKAANDEVFSEGSTLEEHNQTIETRPIEIAPTQVQKDFSRIIREIGTPAQPPKLRHKSEGRKLGTTQSRRERHKIVYKTGKRPLNDTG